jgi:16S rRNA (cytosine967-C5)-methyltransferase
MTPRLAALQVLLAIEQGGITLAAALEQARRQVPDDRDRGLTVELATGTLRWRAELNALLAACSTRPIEKLTPPIRAILQLTAYQLEHLDRIPAHAALHEAVEMTRAAGEPRAAGFVNAVLRTFQRTRAALKLPDREAPLAFLSTTLSHPSWLVERWVARHGFDAAEQWCRFNNSAPEVTIRSVGRWTASELLARIRDIEPAAAPARFVGDAIVLPPGTLGQLPSEVSDELLVQDEASQIVAHAVGAAPGQHVLDLCAAPGAKTIVLSQALDGRGRLVACDYRASRVRLLGRMLHRAGADARVVRLDATQPLPFGAIFDRVFVDAPCSGLGIIRRDPDLKWSRQPGDLAGFALAQQRMLAQAAEVVAPGGRLIYATCSSEPDENDDVVDAFLAKRSDFAEAPLVFGPTVRASEPLVDDRGRLRTLPFRDGLDAFFAAALVRRV